MAWNARQSVISQGEAFRLTSLNPQVQSGKQCVLIWQNPADNDVKLSEAAALIYLCTKGVALGMSVLPTGGSRLI